MLWLPTRMIFKKRLNQARKSLGKEDSTTILFNGNSTRLQLSKRVHCEGDNIHLHVKGSVYLLNNAIYKMSSTVPNIVSICHLFLFLYQTICEIILTLHYEETSQFEEKLINFHFSEVA